MPSAGKTWSLGARILWIAAPLAVVAGLAAFVLWPRTHVFYSDGEKTWAAKDDAGLRSVLWDAGAVLAGLSEAGQDYDPCLSGDGREIYFTRGKAGGGADLYAARRTLDGWGEPAPVAAVNTAADEIGPALARDGAALYFYSNRPGGEGGYDLYVARRTADGWGEPANLGPRSNTVLNEYDPALTPDGTTLLFASNRPVEGESDADARAWRATLREEPYEHDYDLYALDLADAAARPVRLAAASGRANDGQPAVSPDGKWLYFASDRPGGFGGFDLWRSRITVGPVAGLLPPENLGRPINTPANELDPAVSLEGFGLYFSSNRAHDEQYAIYYALSHEVFQVVRTERLAIGPILGALSWPLIGLILALAGLALTLLALARLRRRPGLLASALMVSLILHLIALSLFTVWELSYRVSELVKQKDRFEVAVTIPGLAESELSSQLRAALADLARLDTAELAVEKSETETAPEPPRPTEPEVALATLQPVPQEIEIAPQEDHAEELAEPLRPQDEPAPIPDPLPPEPVEPVQPKPPRPAERAEPLQPREVAVTRLAAAPVREAAAPPPPPAEQRPAVPPELAPLAMPDAPPEEMSLPPLEAVPAPPEAVRAPDVMDIAPLEAETAARPVRIAADPSADAPSTRPLAAARAETSPPEPAAVRQGPAPAAPEARPAAEATLLARPAEPSAGADAAAVVVEEALSAGPAVAPADVADMLPPAAGPIAPKVPAPRSNGVAETEPGARAVVDVRRAEGPVAATAAPAVVAPLAEAEMRLGPDAVGAEPLAAPQVAALPPGPSPAIDLETAVPGPLAVPPAAAEPVDLAVPSAPMAPRAVLPEAPPVTAGPRERLATAAPRQPVVEPAEVRAVPPASLKAEPVEPDARTLLASTAQAGRSVATPVVGESVVAAALPPAAPVDDVGAPPAPLPPKEIYRLRTVPDRKETIEKLGGTPETEEAVRKAIVWLARHQSPDGRWDVDEFMSNYADKGRRAGGGGGRPEYDVGVTALATLVFLGSGHAHLPARGAGGKPSEYAPAVGKAVDFLLAGQKPDGDMRGDGQMYDHCLATMALAESFSMTGDGRLAEPIRRAVAFLVNAQTPGSAWRYQPRVDSDTSVVGWALMALKSAEISGAAIPPKAYRGAANWLDKVRSGRQGGLYEYQPGQGPTPSMTAEGLFTQMLVGLQPGSPRNQESVEYILDHLPGTSRAEEDENLYYWYYATMALHQYGGPKWDEWNARVRRSLVQSQRKDGPFAGSWDPRNERDKRAGRVYTTALGALALEVYYRYLPFYDLRLGDRAAPK